MEIEGGLMQQIYISRLLRPDRFWSSTKSWCFKKGYLGHVVAITRTSKESINSLWTSTVSGYSLIKGESEDLTMLKKVHDD